MIRVMGGARISLEGPDASGKTTQIKRLVAALEAEGIRVEATREPRGTALGQALFSLHDLEPVPLAELMLMLAQRAQHVATVVRPRLDEGCVVLCDRFIDASVVYQGYGRGLAPPLVRALNYLVTDGLTPALTFVLDIPPSVAAERLQRRRKDRFEREAEAFHARVREGYRALVAREPRMRLVDGTQSPEAVTRMILDAILAFLRTPSQIDPAARPA
jgi:dTMP kinase